MTILSLVFSGNSHWNRIWNREWSKEPYDEPYEWRALCDISPVFPQKSPVSPQKSPTSLQWSPIPPLHLTKRALWWALWLKSPTWHDSKRLPLNDPTHLYARRDTLMCANWLIPMCEMTDSHGRHDSNRLLWDDPTHANLRFDLSMCQTWLRIVNGQSSGFFSNGPFENSPVMLNSYLWHMRVSFLSVTCVSFPFMT